MVQNTHGCRLQDKHWKDNRSHILTHIRSTTGTIPQIYPTEPNLLNFPLRVMLKCQIKFSLFVYEPGTCRMAKICLLLRGFRSGLRDAMTKQSNINQFNQKTGPGEHSLSSSSSSSEAAEWWCTHHSVKTEARVHVVLSFASEEIGF